MAARVQALRKLDLIDHEEVAAAAIAAVLLFGEFDLADTLTAAIEDENTPLQNGFETSAVSSEWKFSTSAYTSTS